MVHLDVSLDLIDKLSWPVLFFSSTNQEPNGFDAFVLEGMNPAAMRFFNIENPSLMRDQFNLSVSKDHRVSDWLTLFKNIEDLKINESRLSEMSFFGKVVKVNLVKQDEKKLVVICQTVVPFETENTSRINHQELVLLRSALDAVPDMIAIKDLNETYQIVNKKVREYYCDRFDTIEGKTIEEVYPKSEVEVVRAIDEEAKRKKVAIRKKLRVMTDSGYVVTDIVRAPILNDKNEVTGLVSVGRDITEAERTRKEWENQHKKLEILYRQVVHASLHDYLTKIGNRRKFFKAITTLEDIDYYFLSIDLDNFKLVNDDLGHHIGDEVLVGFSASLKRICERYDGEAFRTGGDEFYLVVPNKNLNFSFENYVAELKKLLKTYHDKLSFSHSIVTCNGKSLQNECAQEALLKKADSLLYHHKRKATKASLE